MTNKEMRKAIANIMISNNIDMYELSVRLAIRIGITYITLYKKNNIMGINFEEEYVPIINKHIKLIYDEVRINFNAVHIWELREEQVNKLRKQIVMGSMFISDYANSFGVNPEEVCNFADGYLEVEDEYENWYKYIQSIEIC